MKNPILIIIVLILAVYSFSLRVEISRLNYELVSCQSAPDASEWSDADFQAWLDS